MTCKKRPVLAVAAILATFAFVLQSPAANASVSPERAKAVFEKLKKLTGEWRAKSTKGWTEKLTYDVIAGGSVIMERSYGAHPNEWMATMIHLDGDRLLLTHYCIAKNQPRLVATNVSDDLSKITFEFLDGTNLPSRDKGHMDKVVYRFAAPDRITARWTWYQDGKESWMEEIEQRRVGSQNARVKMQSAKVKPVGFGTTSGGGISCPACAAKSKRKS